MPLPTPINYSLDYRYMAGTSCSLGGFLAGLAGEGLALRNPYDLGMKHSESAIPGAPGMQFTSDNQAAAVDLRVTGEQAADDPETLQSSLSFLIAKLQESRLNPEIGVVNDSYLRLGLYNGSSMEYHRRYCRFVNSIFPMTPKTQMRRADLIELLFRSHDPGLYGDTENSEAISVSSGSGNKVINPAGNKNTGRATIEILKDGASNPTNVTVTGIKGSFTISGSLTTIDDKWMIDMYYGQEWLDPASGSNSDISDSFSGQHFDLNVGADLIQVSDTAGSTFTVTVKWIDRYH